MANHSWQILCWNIRGLNASGKWDAVREKIEESACSILCLQETKKEHFDSRFISNFAPRRFDSFEYIPSLGASGGILVARNGSYFFGLVIDRQHFAIMIEFTSRHTMESWKLTTVYGPCTEPDRSNFITWFSAHQIADDDNRLFLGDFNFYRSLQDRNREGGNLQDTLIFSEAIGELGLVELPLKGKAYTWSNMQANPLLGQLDWFFSSVNWTQSYPNTLVLPMAKITSDHIPCKVIIDTKSHVRIFFASKTFGQNMMVSWN